MRRTLVGLLGAAVLIAAGPSAVAAATAPQSAPTQSLLQAPGPAGPLEGTLLSPPSPTATVLIIPGSGPTDRNGDSPLGVTASPYRLLAEALAERGVASVRIDKRGMFGSAKAVPDPNAVTIKDYAADIRTWVGAIRQRTGAHCVWLIGHSEGGLVALAAARDDSDVCGVVLLEAPGRRLGEVLREQLKANPANAPVLGQATAALQSLEQGRRYDTTGMHPGLLPLFRPQVQDFLIDALSYDPAAMMAAVRKPVLVIQGGRDLQVSEQDARRLAGANPAARLVTIADMNHVLKSVATDDPAANYAAYADSSLPLAPTLVPAISDFLRSAGRP